jgi:tetratricopeptide (TPR) repeat protein
MSGSRYIVRTAIAVIAASLPLTAHAAERGSRARLDKQIAIDSLDYKTMRRIGEEELTRCEPARPIADECLEFLISLGYNAGPSGDPAAGERYARAAVALADRTLPAGHKDIERSLESLRSALEYQRDYAAAEMVFRRVVAIRRSEVPGDPAKLTTALKQLADNLVEQGRFLDAETVYREALVLGEASNDTELIVIGLGNLAYILNLQAQHAEAEKIYRRLLVMAARIVGPESADMAKIIQNLATTVNAQGRHAEAEALLRRSLAMQEKAPFSSDSANGATMLNLAGNLLDQGRPAEAEALARRTVVAWNYVYAFNSELRIATELLADALAAQGRMGEAEALYRKAAAVGMGLPLNHPDHIGTAHRLAKFLRKQGNRPAETRTLFAIAGRGALLRMGTFKGFDRSAEAELRRYRPIFLGQVRTAWDLSRNRKS